MAISVYLMIKQIVILYFTFEIGTLSFDEIRTSLRSTTSKFCIHLMKDANSFIWVRSKNYKFLDFNVASLFISSLGMSKI